MTRPTIIFGILLALTAGSRCAEPQNGTFLFRNLHSLRDSFSVDDPAVTGTDPRGNGNVDGPKGIATADLDGDALTDIVVGNTDGTIAVLFQTPSASQPPGQSAKTGFESARHLIAGSPSGLREVITANVKGDSKQEIIAAHPFDGRLYIFAINEGTRTFQPAQAMKTWRGARCVVAGDFNGDGITDLVVAGPGGTGGSVREYRGSGTGSFVPFPSIGAIDAGKFLGNSATPVFSMYAWRRAGEGRDSVAVSYEGAPRIWILKSAGPGQPLGVASVVELPTAEINGVPAPAEKVVDIAMGYVTLESHTTNEPDLLTADPGGRITIRSSVSGFYRSEAQSTVSIPGGPRGLSVPDLNNDSWHDPVVVTRYGNNVYLLRNLGGNLTIRSVASAGASPRGVVTADFDGNGLPDAAVINRDSQDVTVHRIDPASSSFLANQLTEKNTGGVSAVTIKDMDLDGRGELLYLNSSSGTVTIRTVLPTGRLGVAREYSMGNRPQTLGTPDVNGDGLPDLQCCTVGDFQVSGGISYRLQNPDHTFGELQEALPASMAGRRMLSEIVSDFNNDGRLDQVAVSSSGEVELFEGTSNGLVYRGSLPSFVRDCRALGALDLDGDGDVDLVGAGASGEVAIGRNDGNLFGGGQFSVTTLPRIDALIDAFKVSSSDLNGDGIPDLVVFSKRGVAYWYGAPGMTFTLEGVGKIPDTLDVVSGDFDGDGHLDSFAVRPSEVSISYFGGIDGTQNLWWTEPSERYSIPSTRYLATGDIDNDGRPDIVGIGEYIWVALSGTLAPALVPTIIPTVVPEVNGVVINEVLAATTRYVPVGVSQPVDCVELYNGTSVTVPLAGWRLRRVAEAGEAQAADYLFPTGQLLQPGGRTVVYCTGNNAPLHAPFKLPDSGATLQLLNGSGVIMDTVIYVQQEPDISYSRLVDGSRTFVYNPLPSIGSANYDNGSTAPDVLMKGVDPALLSSNVWRFRGRAWSPNGMSTLIVFWREISDLQSPRSGTIPLYDDGLHDDEGRGDGVYAGDWESPLPPGSAIEFYIRGTDLRGNSSTKPDGPSFRLPGEALTNYSLSIPEELVDVEFSELVAKNQNGLRDENGETPDYAILRFIGGGTGGTDISEFFLSDSMLPTNPNRIYFLGNQVTAASPGMNLVVFLDDTPLSAGVAGHAPFKLSGNGDSVYLFRRLSNGASELVDWVTVPPMGPDVSYTRIEPRGDFAQLRAILNTPVVPFEGATFFVVPGVGPVKECHFYYKGPGAVESSTDAATWTIVSPFVPDDGKVRVYRRPMTDQRRFFRVR